MRVTHFFIFLKVSLFVSLNLEFVFKCFSWVLHFYPVHQSLPFVWNASLTFNDRRCLHLPLAVYFCMSHVLYSSILPLLPFFVFYKILMYHFSSAIDFLIMFFLSVVFKECEELG